MQKKASKFFETNKKLFLTNKTEFLKVLFKSELNPVHILALSLNKNIFNSYFCEDINLFTEILDYIYSQNRAYVISDILTLDNINENTAFFINAYLASKNSSVYSKELDYINTKLKDILSYIIKGETDSDDIKYIKELLYYQGDTNFTLKKISKINANEENLRAIFSACCFATPCSRLAFNFVRVATMVFPDIVFPAIFNLCRDDINIVFIFIEKYKLHQKELFNWIIQTPYYYNKANLSVLYNQNKELFINAAQKCPPNDEANLYMSTKLTNTSRLMDLYTSCNVDTRIAILDYVFKLNPSLNYIYVCRCIDDTSKQVSEKIISLLKPYQPAHRACTELLNNSKVQIRETAVKILADSKEPYILETLIMASKIEKNINLKFLMLSIVGVSSDKANDSINFVDYCSKTAKNSKKIGKILWLNPNSLPDLHYSDGKILENEVYHYILIAYATEKFSQDNILENIISRTNSDDLSNLSLELLKRWKEIDTDTKQKWILNFVCSFGNAQVITTLEQFIYNWLYQSRRSIASKTLDAIKSSPIENSQIIASRIEENIKNKKTKELVDDETKNKGFK